MMALMKKAMASAWLMFIVTSAQAHTFFIGSTNIIVNEHTQSIEVIHRLTSHDLEAVMAEKHQMKVDPDSPLYLSKVQAYIEQGFSLTTTDGKPLKLTFVGVEAGINDTFIYQEVEGITRIKDVSVFHHLLTDFYPKQKNRVNYQSPTRQGSLLFDDKIRRDIMR